MNMAVVPILTCIEVNLWDLKLLLTFNDDLLLYENLS